MANRTNVSSYTIIERLLFINKKISNNLYPNPKELARDLEVSVPTIYRDINFLRDRLRAPLEYDSFNMGYYYSSPFNLFEMI